MNGRSCDKCEWCIRALEVCAESNPWKPLPSLRWCGRFRLREDLAGGKDAREASR